MRLVIVESPAKCKTIGKYLGEDYKVMASYGHIRDLAIRGKGGLGVDMENGYTATYVNDPKKNNIIRDLIKAANEADEVILATDPDREGEAIAWHLCSILNLPVETTLRLEFHEITKEAIQHAIENPRTLDMNLVESQECRRILDRIVGFTLTGILKKKIKTESAGRVQSATLKLIVDHEKEIEYFIPEDYWTIEGTIKNDQCVLDVDLDRIDDHIAELKEEEYSKNIYDSLSDTYKVVDIKKVMKKRESKPAFTTSTLQQEAFSKLKFATKKTSLVAQNLYEGREINGELVGLITYMRTDSVRLSPNFIESAKQYINEKYGPRYVGLEKTTNKKGQVQDAHEAIRPTSISRTPDSIKKYLSKDEYNLYRLIYNRAVASLMAANEYESTTIKFQNENTVFKSNTEFTTFDGYFVLYKDTETEENEKGNKVIPTINIGDIFKNEKVELIKHTTQPPAHYTEGKVVKLMEELGIGRPSTYASTISLLLKREYIKSEKNFLIPQKDGKLTSLYLDQFFIRIINTSFTAEMEETLDNVANKKETRVHLLDTFCDFFFPLVHKAEESPYQIPEQFIENLGTCPECGKPLVRRKGMYGEFIACSSYPTCNYVQKKEKEPAQETGELCPKCGKPMVYRKNKKGEQFEACSNFPKCKYIKDAPEVERIVVKPCPKCGADLILKKGVRGRSSFLGCSNFPKCRYAEPYKEEK